MPARRASSRQKSKRAPAVLVRVWVCDECGSAAVSYMDWIDANTDTIIGGAFPKAAMGETFCEDCEANPELVERLVSPHEAARLLKR